MVDESTGNKYMRAVDHKGLEGKGDNSWLVRDMHEELKSWGHLVGGRNAIILKRDGEPAIVAVKGIGKMPWGYSDTPAASEGGASGQRSGRGGRPNNPRPRSCTEDKPPGKDWEKDRAR